MGRFSCLLVCGAIFGLLFVHFAAAQNVYVVGDGMGWDIPTNTSVSYANWASPKTFIVGDILVFNFITNQHDVLQVPQASYDACTQDNAIGSIITNGPANITLDSTGDHHYICTLGRHCEFGQKLAITVVSSTPSGANPPMTTPPTIPTTPSPDSPQPDACPPTSSLTPNAESPAAPMSPPTEPPLPYSASTSVAASFLLGLLSTCIAIIF